MNWGGTTKSTNSSQFASPTHQFGTTAPTQPVPSPRAPSTPIHQSRSPTAEHSSKADYNRAHFDQNNTNGKTKQAGVGGDIFGDILGQQGYNFATKANFGPRSINEMRKEELVREMDPDKLKIMEWVFIIISSIHFILNIQKKKKIFCRLKVKKIILELYYVQCIVYYGVMLNGINVKCIN